MQSSNHLEETQSIRTHVRIHIIYLDTSEVQRLRQTSLTFFHSIGPIRIWHRNKLLLGKCSALSI